MSVVIFLLILFFSIVGLCDIFQSVRLALLKTKNRNNRIVFCILKDDFAELDLRYVIEQYKWSGKQFAHKIVAINHLEDKEVLECCRELADSYNISIIDESQIHTFLNTEN